jgi:hypothetical protein
MSMREAERQTATQVFGDLSTLLDKRRYRMQQVCWKLSDHDATAKLIELHMENYRAILFEWNDNLNRNLALIDRYFSEDARN